MSSLAAARADGYYYGPEFNYKTHKSLNKYRNSHALGKRAARINEGILIIRFEIPFKIHCLGCSKIIDKGVRFDARKVCIGHYFTTKIWKFSMNCVGCKQEFEITTDPKNSEYLCTKGVRKTAAPPLIEQGSGIELPEYDIPPPSENQSDLSQEPSSESARISRLYKSQHLRYSDSFLTNSVLRQSSRIARKIEEQKKAPELAIHTPEAQEQLRIAEKGFKKDVAISKHKKIRSTLLKSSIFGSKTQGYSH